MMSNAQRLVGALFAFSLLALCTPAAEAQFAFTLSSPTLLTTAAPDTFRFDGTITNNSTSDAYVNDLVFNLNGNPLTTDTNVFFRDVPGVFAAGDTYTGHIFDVAINAGAAPAVYTGTVNIVGDPTGNDPNATTPLSTPVQFQVSSAAPEAGTLSLAGIGGIALLGTGLLRRRQEKATA